MNTLKSTMIAFLIAFSLGSFSSVAFALQKNDAGLQQINTNIDAAIQQIDANDYPAAMESIKQAKRGKKMLNSEQNAPKIGRLSAHFTSAKKHLKKSEPEAAKAELEKAKHGYNSLKL
ncbi:hypothetical protein [Methyloprofundus sp.]|uniref:hypothetical protein n=1 Tax=Methyloprofundus sp. TaxID=2020875 RepID=UPI003D0A1B69